MKSNKSKKPLYMDYASSAMPNPGAIHKKGTEAKNLLESSRQTIAKLLGILPKEVFFTSGGTESNNLAILGLIKAVGCPTPDTQVSDTRRKNPHVITTNIEHPSVLYTCEALLKRGEIDLTIVPVEENGIVDPKKIKKEIRENTVLVSVMYANNEIGTIQPIKEIAKEIRHYRKHNSTVFPYFHTDAVQAGNHLDLFVPSLGVDMLTLSGAKIFGGAHAGLLFKKHSINIEPIFYGGDQEQGLRAGTPNVEAIDKFTTALVSVQNNKDKKIKQALELQKYFLKKLENSKIIKNLDISLNGDLEDRLPNNINITVKNIPSDLLVLELDAKNIYVSSKSACKEGDGKASYVIKAINKNFNEKDGSLRFSFGPETKKADINFVVKVLEDIFLKLKKWYS